MMNIENKMATNIALTEALCCAADALHAAANALLKDSIVNPGAPADDSSAPRKRVTGKAYANAYFAACHGLQNLAEQIGVPVFKMGLTQQTLRQRQADLAADQYGSVFKTDGGFEDSPGFSKWEMLRMTPKSPDPASRVSVGMRALSIDLADTSFPAFERRFREQMRNFSLATWAASPVGLARLSEAGLDRGITQRFTEYHFSGKGDVRRSESSELYVIRPRKDLNQIIARIDGILNSAHRPSTKRA